VTCQEDAALELLACFVSSKLRQYETKRQLADARAVSRLSPYLHSGELSVRRMYHTMAQANARQVGALRVFPPSPFPTN
jgi:deoxyribodipyrimidine photolyase